MEEEVLLGLIFLLFQEKVGQRVRDAGIQGLAIAQQGANVLATARGGPPH